MENASLHNPLIDKDVCVTHEDDIESEKMKNTESSAPSKNENLKKNDFKDWAYTWTEDGVGLYLAMSIFPLAIILSQYGQSWKDAWPLGHIAIAWYVISVVHYVLNKPLNYEAYSLVVLIAVTARAIGNYSALSHAGMSASLWGIVIGIAGRTILGLDVKEKGVLNGEFFVKVGVALLAMDYASIVTIGLPGLIVAWGDTVLIILVGTALCYYYMKFPLRDSIVVAGATSICGSSAATAISSSIHPPGYKDEAAKTIIALMGLFNAPLMPLMPLLHTQAGINPAVIGAWIGGSIDSTGQVTASAQMGGDTVLKAAIIIKMAQNFLIGPICLVLTGHFQKSYKLSILFTKFPQFVTGFLLVSAVTTVILHTDHPAASQKLKDHLISNAWDISEWMTLLGFACIGLEIDLRAFLSKKNAFQQRILYVYLLIQTLDLCSTFGWSYLMFRNKDLSDDDTGGDDNITRRLV